MITDDLKWLSKLVSDLPALEPAQQTLFDILGVSTREVAISRVLAYYLDENEAHGLKRLFLKSLITCMNEQGSLIDKIDKELLLSPYTVKREKNNIDILIQGESDEWAIIIENKIYHHLHNDLRKYWDSVNATHKVGVIVTLQPLDDKSKKLVPADLDFVNITHLSWLNQVENLWKTNFSTDQSGREQLLFTDFVKTMTNNTNALINNPDNNRAIRRLQEHREGIAKLNATQKVLEQYIQDHISAVFARHNFQAKGSQFYYPDEKKSKDGSVAPSVSQFRFYIMDEILTEDKLSIYFELYGESTRMGNQLLKAIKEQEHPPGFEFDDKKKEGDYYHLAYIKQDKVMESNDLPNTLEEIVGRFFTENNSLVDFCKQH